jgi:hypothetical protein
LPPELLLADTTDPFTGHPLRLTRTADGLTVYSVGPDKADDGGAFARDRNVLPRPDSGWRLWDVAARHAGGKP